MFDPATGTWTATGSLNAGRFDVEATSLADGRVLVAGGGRCCPYTTLASAEVYDPGTGLWTPTGAMSTIRGGHGLVRLPGGRVLAVGGSAGGEVGGVETDRALEPAGEKRALESRLDLFDLTDGFQLGIYDYWAVTFYQHNRPKPTIVRSIADRLVQRGLFTADALAQRLAALEGHLADPGTITVSSTLFQVWGRTPTGPTEPAGSTAADG